MINSHIFSPWSEAERNAYLILKTAESESIYEEGHVGNDPLSRTKYLLTKLNISEAEYEKRIRLNGRPEILSELESNALKV
jgi:hypothetical protein